MFLTKNKTEEWKLSLSKNAKNGIEPDDGYQTKNGTARNRMEQEQNKNGTEPDDGSQTKNGTEWNKNGTIGK